jgi:nicotinamide phosphoribosyltransferase
MSKTIYPATLLCDFYKVSHREQYPKGTQMVYSTWTPRASLIEGITKVIAFGFQGFIKKYLIKYFDRHFFKRSKEAVVAEYVRYIRYTLGVENPDASHIAILHDLGYLPIRIKGVAEGTRVPLRVPMLTIENTRPDIFPEFFWLTNYLESLMSSELWHPSTAATISDAYYSILYDFAIETVGDASAVQFQGHDFSFRGMLGLEASASSGAAHLTSFVGTDSIPAIGYLEEYYKANIERELVGTSIPATEHSVMCSGILLIERQLLKNGEYKDVKLSDFVNIKGENKARTVAEILFFKDLITETYPKGFISIVSDSFDLWGMMEYGMPYLKGLIMARDGKMVIRPDSGDPVKIICGDPESDNEFIRKGLVEVLWDIFGGTMTEKGYKLLDSHIGAIYGDAITLVRCKEICQRLKDKGFASTNMVYGIGSFTYQYTTRDTFGFALKSTFVKVNGEEINIYKDPATDAKKIKKSQTGLVSVVNTATGIKCLDTLSIKDRNDNANIDLLRDIFVEGKLIVDDSLENIRARIKAIA